MARACGAPLRAHLGRRGRYRFVHSGSRKARANYGTRPGDNAGASEADPTYVVRRRTTLVLLRW
jgi:hypothetical protein